MTDEGELVFRPARAAWLLPASLIGTAVLNARLVHPLALLGLPFALGWLAALVRARTVAGDAGLRVRVWRRTVLLPWAEVAALRRQRAGVVAVTRSGETCPLPGVEWRPPLAAGSPHVHPGSAQALGERARAAGADVVLEDGQPR